MGITAVTRAFLLSRPSVCDPIKAPDAVALDGFYPTLSCVRHDADGGEYTISLENFVHRNASAREVAAPRK